MDKNTIENEYFNWLCDIVNSNKKYSDNTSYRKLLMFLHDVEFTYILHMDKNRASDGMDLRYRFSLESGYRDAESYLTGPCSVLEMMVGLALRCEETIMDNPKYGNRTGQWFWGMVNNLGLGSMVDKKFDKKFSTIVITKFLNREYSSNGKGGLFTIRNCNRDLREVEIWYQLSWYVDRMS